MLICLPKWSVVPGNLRGRFCSIVFSNLTVVTSNIDKSAEHVGWLRGDWVSTHSAQL